MRGFLYLDLAAAEQPVSYQKATINLVKTYFPDVALLDLDATSDELLVHYAKRMIQEAEQLIVYIKADESTSIKSFATLLEDLLEPNPQKLILLGGDSQRLLRILEARPQLNFKRVETEPDLFTELEQFYT